MTVRKEPQIWNVDVLLTQIIQESCGVLCCCYFAFRDRVSLALAGTHVVDQSDLELVEVHLPPPPQCWD